MGQRCGMRNSKVAVALGRPPRIPNEFMTEQFNEAELLKIPWSIDLPNSLGSVVGHS